MKDNMAKAEDYIGLTKRSSQDKAERDSLVFRLIRIDKEDFLSYPDDERTDRICVEIDDGKVSKATIK